MKAKPTKKEMAVKITTQKFLIGVLTTVVALSALLGGVRLVLAATDTEVENKVNQAVVLYALQNPESEMAMVLAKYMLVSEQNVLAGLEAEREAAIGVLRDEENEVRAERVCHKFADSTFRYACEGWGRFAIPTTASATTTASEVNRLGRNVIVDYAEVELTGTVSSTFNIYVGTATSTFVDYDAGAGGLHPRPDNLIDGFEFVTSTTDVEATDRIDTYRNIINSVNDAGTNGVNAVPMVSSTALVFFMQSDYGAACGSGTGASYCQQVTSTARGFDGYVRYHYRYEIDF